MKPSRSAFLARWGRCPGRCRPPPPPPGVDPGEGGAAGADQRALEDPNEGTGPPPPEFPQVLPPEIRPLFFFCAAKCRFVFHCLGKENSGWAPLGDFFIPPPPCLPQVLPPEIRSLFSLQKNYKFVFHFSFSLVGENTFWIGHDWVNHPPPQPDPGSDPTPESN